MPDKKMANLKILFFGDVVGKPGRQAIKKIMPKLKDEYDPDFVVLNAENISHGKGVTEDSLKEMTDIGVDAFTSGNHIFAKKDIIGFLEKEDCALLRPANYPAGVPGTGFKIFQVRTKKILVINLMGRVYLRRDFDDPFAVVDKILKDYGLKNSDADEKVDAIIVDLHAEASSEKKALGWYLDGRVSAVLGTHTHTQTADEQILPQSTAHISDVGMAGALESILGVQKEKAVQLFLTQMPQHLEVEENSSKIEVGAVLIEIDNKTGLAENIIRIREIIKI